MFKDVFKYILIVFFIFTIQIKSYSQSRLKSELANPFIISSTQVPDSILTVVEYASEVWSNYIKTSVPINLHVVWRELSPNVNAYAKPSQMYYNIEGLPYSNILYPAALAEKILSKNLNFNNPDIELVINSSGQWNVDLNNIIFTNKYDLATVVIHELCHGLGFIGNIGLQASKPTLVGVPTIFDKFITYRDTVSIINLFNNSLVSQDSLTNVLTSNLIFWNGIHSKSILGFSPEMYAPSVFNSGSSIYHFDELLFPIGDTNSLMTYVISAGEVLRNPGMAAITILADIGWNDFFLHLQEQLNVSDVYHTLTISFDCIDTLYVDTLHTLLYSIDNGRNFQELLFTYNSISEEYEVTLPTLPFEHTVSYAIRSVSVTDDSLYYPVEYPERLFSFFVGSDVQAPEISYASINSIPESASSYEFEFSVTDNFSIDSVYINYIIGRNDFATIIKTGRIRCNYSDYLFRGLLSLQSLLIQEGDVIAYNIFAVDMSSNISSIMPLGEYVFVPFESVLPAVVSFSTDFESDTVVDCFNFDKFSIFKESSFSNKALHTAHPYVSSYIDGKYVQYIAELKYPIVIQQNPAEMSFDEVVLVEPSEPSVEFGMYGFWDYVAVEGSKDRINWFILGKDGYDSRSKTLWLQTFYSSITSENNNSSNAIGAQSMYFNHTINLLENKYFRTSDTIYIRFRLQSDFNRHGWGWAIDNLKIQEEYSSIITPKISSVIIYPTIVDSDCNILSDERIEKVMIYSLHGNLLHMQTDNTSLINCNTFKAGSYLVKVITENNSEFTQVIIKK